VVVWSFLHLVATAQIAHAQEAPPPPTPAVEKPWAKGVTPAKRTEALSWFREGNEFFEQSKYGQALVKYQEAIQHWDHPSIQFNLTVCLVHLDRPLEAAQTLERALRFGQGSLSAKLYQEALTYQRLLQGQLARLEVVCSAPGAQVSLDGKPFFSGPGSRKATLLPGDHQVVVSKAGFLTITRSLILFSGRDHRVELKLVPLGTGGRVMKKRWRRPPRSSPAAPWPRWWAFRSSWRRRATTRATTATSSGCAAAGRGACPGTYPPG